MDNFSVLRWSRTFVVACAKKTCELPVYYNTIRNFSKVQLKLCRRRTALSSLPQNPAPEPSAPPALIQNTSLRCDWFSCHLPESWQCFQNLQWSGARPKCRQNILPSSSWRWFSRLWFSPLFELQTCKRTHTPVLEGMSLLSRPLICRRAFSLSM